MMSVVEDVAPTRAGGKERVALRARHTDLRRAMLERRPAATVARAHQTQNESTIDLGGGVCGQRLSLIHISLKGR